MNSLSELILELEAQGRHLDIMAAAMRAGVAIEGCDATDPVVLYDKLRNAAGNLRGTAMLLRSLLPPRSRNLQQDLMTAEIAGALEEAVCTQQITIDQARGVEYALLALSMPARRIKHPMAYFQDLAGSSDRGQAHARA